MKIFEVYINQKKDSIILLENKFSIYAFIFGLFWFASHKLWQAVIYIVIFNLAISIISHYVGNNFSIYINIGLMFMLGIFAYNIYSYYLIKFGYILSTIVVAKNKDEAYMKFYENIEQDI
jgi:hypothetical protein